MWHVGLDIQSPAIAPTEKDYQKAVIPPNTIQSLLADIFPTFRLNTVKQREEKKTKTDFSPALANLNL